jgi:hypothetical protein
MPALEAFTMAKKNFGDYPEFFNDPCATIGASLRRKQ